MPLQPNLRHRLVRVLNTVDDQGSMGPRLTGDAVRLWDRVQKFAAMKLIGADIDSDALELCCYALQLPSRQSRGIIAGKLGRTNLRDRCEQAAELLVSLIGSDVEESLLDRTTRLLHELPHRSPVIDEARLLADAINLDDFGVTGLINQTVQLGLQGEGVRDLVDASAKREEYGYWDARLKDGFQFNQIRAIARQRLESARRVAKMLADEVREDQP
ncbi:MAG: hypothetical protein M3O30_13920 [Planctomycetota bacterium]|nr:hypothetical protein [Planctomycetota bacterium]